MLHFLLDVCCILHNNSDMANRNWLDPAGSVIAALGGTGVVSRITGVDRTQVWRWTQPREKGGTDGLIPPDHQSALLTYAEENDKPVTAEMIIRGASSAKPDMKEEAA
jgi:hypothetical protein